MTAVSPNVVVDILLRLKEERLGLYKGIHTIIITVTACSDVLSIFLFGVVLGCIFSTGIFIYRYILIKILTLICSIISIQAH